MIATKNAVLNGLSRANGKALISCLVWATEMTLREQRSAYISMRKVGVGFTPSRVAPQVITILSQHLARGRFFMPQKEVVMEEYGVYEKYEGAQEDSSV